tara:strand:- start:942 stop:1700 length:759 start_codon:yes stop_codon:yes gene_type:complete
MAIERLWEEIPARSLSADGQSDGLITLQSTIHFRTNQKVKLTATSQPTIVLVVKRVVSSTQMILGPNDKNILSRTDLSQYTVAAIAMVSASEQNKTSIPEKDQLQMTLEREPVNARRVFQVDDFGNPIGTTPENPIHAKLSDGDISIGTVNVQLSRKDNFPDTGDVHDAVRVGNQEHELSFTTNDDVSKAAADVNALNKLIDVPHDDVEITTFNADGDPTVIEFREGGNLKLTLNLTYNTEGDLQRVQRVRA